ncbi:752a9351-7bff-4785-9b49-516a94e5ddcb [Sclerotinia trifoliorum]|uniref:752a9351-7bff-4785-9b49-516a94e5ddcb n=1 Tax=Sclerotinia trifoliorum TaxID=28548 RepID=A0A8H2ZR94_9HELO|nr:752a9351-7bff-4785-9b49-516a94e5ddcb [Sclerotinia trifoliorum]
MESTSSKRYQICKCLEHSNKFVNAPSRDIEIQIGSCGRHCPFCDAEFSRASNLRVHIKVCKNCTNVTVKLENKGGIVLHHSWKNIESKPLYGLSLQNSSKHSDIQTNTFLTQPSTFLPPKPNRILWIPINPVHEQISMAPTLAILFQPTNSELEQDFPWFNRRDATQISEKLGPAFIEDVGKNERPIIHQNIVTMQIFKHNTHSDVDFWSWKDFQEVIYRNEITKILFNQLRQPQNILILLHWTFDESINEIDFHKIFNILQKVPASYGIPLQCFPNYTEVLNTRAKVGDIRALDSIPSSYRPKTCYPGHFCILQDHKETIHKRTNSCGAEHVLKNQKSTKRFILYFG